MQTYYVLITKSNMRDVVVAVIKSLTMLLQNIQKSTSINYILSHPAFNKIITADYNFLDDEIIAYYINLLKCVSIRIDETNLQLFFNLVPSPSMVEILNLPDAAEGDLLLRPQGEPHPDICPQHCAGHHQIEPRPPQKICEELPFHPLLRPIQLLLKRLDVSHRLINSRKQRPAAQSHQAAS